MQKSLKFKILILIFSYLYLPQWLKAIMDIGRKQVWSTMGTNLCSYKKWKKKILIYKKVFPISQNYCKILLSFEKYYFNFVLI